MTVDAVGVQPGLVVAGCHRVAAATGGSNLWKAQRLRHGSLGRLHKENRRCRGPGQLRGSTTAKRGKKDGLLGCVLTWGIVNGGKVCDEIMARRNGVRGRCNFVVAVNSGWAA
jgi:hypothetical protein